MIRYDEIDEFKRDLKKLSKRFRSLSEDLCTIKRAVISLRHQLDIDNLSTFEITGCHFNKGGIWKIRKFACKSLKGKGVKSGMRAIYCWQPQDNLVTWLEIYYKGDKPNEDQDRIKRFISKFEK